MKTMTAKYPGTCVECRKPIARGEIINFYGRGRAAHASCEDSFDRRDHSSYEDRACGDSAYEDRCAEMCNY